MAKKKNTNRRRSIFVDDELWAKIEKQAKLDGRSSASWIRQALWGSITAPC